MGEIRGKCCSCYEWRAHGNSLTAATGYCNFFEGDIARDKGCPHWAIVAPATASKSKKSKATGIRMYRKTATPVIVHMVEGMKVLELYAHQQEAFEKFKDAEDIALFFEMGCGKTLTLLKIAEYKFKKGEIDGLLVVAPNDVHKQWYDDLANGILIGEEKSWELSIDYCVQCVGGRGGQKELVPFDDEDDMLQIVTVNVDTFSTPHKWEPIVEWVNQHNYLICIDEATVIKNPSAQRAQRLLYSFNFVKKRGKTVLDSQKRCPYRAVLTGTPVTNGPIDLWAIMEFVHPNYFNRGYYSFREKYGMFTKLEVDGGGAGERVVKVLLTAKTWEGIKKAQSFDEAAILFGCSEDTYLTVKSQDKYCGPHKHVEELRQLIQPVSMFKKLTDCVDMPAVNYVLRRVQMSDEQKRIYNEMKNSLLATYGEYTTSAKNKLTMATRLQQISSGFIMGKSDNYEALFDEDVPLWAGSLDAAEGAVDELDVVPEQVTWIGASNPKLDALLRDVDELDKPLLILTRFSAEAARIFDALKDKYKCGLFTGWKVVGGIEPFKNKEYDILVANSAKISRGFNLQVAHTTLFYGNTFSMETRQQAEFRTFRMGQEQPCLYVDYSCAPIDDTIRDALMMKKGLLEFLREKESIKEML